MNRELVLPRAQGALEHGSADLDVDGRRIDFTDILCHVRVKRRNSGRENHERIGSQ